MLEELIQEHLEKIKEASGQKRYSDSIDLLNQFRSKVSLTPPSQSEIIELLGQAIHHPNKPGLSLVFVAAWNNLSDAYVSILVKILMNEESKGFHEQAIELLSEIGSIESLPSLIDALNYRWDFDPWLTIPKKTLRAIVSIDGSSRDSILREFLNSGEMTLREEAIMLLSQR